MQGSSTLDNRDALLLSLLTATAFAVRFWRLFHPPGVVFDEVYFGNFSNFYIQSQFFYDIHPPLAKIVAFLFANLSEYDGSINFQNCPGGLYPIADYVQLRVTPALFSALCGPLVYLSVRFASFGPAAATVSAVLTIFDTSLGTEGRHILSDGILHFFSILHIVILIHTMSLAGRGPPFCLWHFLTAASLGAACSCKNTAWGLCAMDGICYIIHFSRTLKLGWLDYCFELFIWGGSLAVVTFLVYVASFSLHLILLPFAGPGLGYLRPEMKAQLIPNDNGGAGLWARRLAGPGLFWRGMWLTLDMHRGNMGITEFHDSMSFPSQWPILHGVMTYFWARDGTEIRCLGNVFSYYFALLGVFLSPYGFRCSRCWNALVFCLGWSVCYFPFYFVPRVMYQYHYCIPLMIGTMAFGASMDLVVPKKWKHALAVVVICLAVFGFWLWSPFTYGTKQHDAGAAIWSRSWVDGTADHRSRRASHWAAKVGR
jgi:dolichyl-phosphate-mannose--protein O-mannosyl transferase